MATPNAATVPCSPGTAGTSSAQPSGPDEPSDVLQPSAPSNLAPEAPIAFKNDNDDAIAAPPAPERARHHHLDLVSTKSALSAAHFAAASLAHLAAATQDLHLAMRVNNSIASAASAASTDLSGWGDLRDALREKLTALGTLTAESISEALEPRVKELEREAEELDSLSKKLARAVGVLEEEGEEEDDEDEDDEDEEDDEESESKNKKKKKQPNSSSSSATAAATAAASAAANAASAAASKLWNRWGPSGEKR